MKSEWMISLLRTGRCAARTKDHSWAIRPPADRSVVQGIIFARTENGQMVEDWTLIDELGILQQLGLVPPPRGT